ncbi:phage tail protein [Acinetobacter proteolyticus]|nr:phage tail protein [Acinetobacter proteolyticus]WEI20149.1 phage tail protein [Acinetobacter proteolyticus]
MGGSSKQTVGFKYFAGMQVAIGNCIDQILNINPDKRGWIFTKPAEIAQLKLGDTSMMVNKPDLFGGDKQEGGWVGTIDIHTGRESGLRQNEYLATQDSELVSSFPNLSHLVFRGSTLDKGFQLVSMSGMLKEVLYWPKRTRIKDDGSEQWYKTFIKDGKEQVVCEVGSITIYNAKDYITDEVKINKNYTIVSNVLFQNGTSTSTNWSVMSVFPVITPGMNASYSQAKKITMYSEGLFEAVYKFSGYIEYNFPQSFKFDTYGCTLLKEVVNQDTATRYSFEISVFGSGSVGLSFNSSSGGMIVNESLSFIQNGEFYSVTDGYDINPIHQIREIVTNDTAMNKPESMINDDNFKSAARRIWNEGLGVSGAFTEKSCKEAIDELLFHIEAGIRLNRQTGQYEIVLFRDDLLSLSTAQVFNKSNIKSFNIEIANIDDVINSVNVNYYDRDNIKDSSFSLDEIGSVMSSEVNAQTLDFPYFMNRRNAELVGNWKLKQLSTPTRKGTFTTE